MSWNVRDEAGEGSQADHKKPCKQLALPGLHRCPVSALSVLWSNELHDHPLISHFEKCVLCPKKTFFKSDMSWTDGSVVKDTCCSYIEPGFSSQHPCGDSQLSITPISRV